MLLIVRSLYSCRELNHRGGLIIFKFLCLLKCWTLWKWFVSANIHTYCNDQISNRDEKKNLTDSAHFEIALVLYSYACACVCFFSIVHSFDISLRLRSAQSVFEKYFYLTVLSLFFLFPYDDGTYIYIMPLLHLSSFIKILTLF